MESKTNLWSKPVNEFSLKDHAKVSGVAIASIFVTTLAVQVGGIVASKIQARRANTQTSNESK